MANFVKLVEEPLDVAAISNLVVAPSTGATSVFVGTTRDNFEGKRVFRLEYEAYESMAVKEMEKVCARLRSKWPDAHGVAIYHRLGVVPVTEASVVIAVSSAHRKAALEAAHFAIDDLKANVPIWKKEVYEDGEAWKENAECKWSKKNADSR